MTKIAHHPLPFEALQAGLGRWTEQLRQLNDAVDPYGIAASVSKVAGGWLAHPQEFSLALARLGIDLQHLQFHAWQMALGLPEPKPPVAAAHDERFTDPAWSEIPAFSLVKQYYLLYTHWLEDTLYDAPGAEPRSAAVPPSGRGNGSTPSHPPITSAPIRSRCAGSGKPVVRASLTGCGSG